MRDAPALATSPDEADKTTPPRPEACEAYLDAYAKCEDQLRAEVEAGNRRTARAERAWIEYLRTTPEGAGLPDACKSMLDELRRVCPP